MKKYFFLLAFYLLNSSVFSQKYILVFLHKKEQVAELPPTQLNELMEGHLSNINRLAREGKLVVAGPFDGGGGIFIFNSASSDEVHTWLSTDPAIQANRWNIELTPYQPRQGAVCPAPEPYQMVAYSFIRFQSNLAKDNVQEASDLMKKHHDFIRLLPAENLLTEAFLGDENDSVLILRNEVTLLHLEPDAAVAEGLLQPVLKKLWVAKGSFCEK
jgi:uncharacterized protein YciI